MSKRTIKRAATAALAACAIFTIPTPTAQATTTDAAYLAALAEQGIYNTTGPDHYLVDMGHDVCTDLDRGYTFLEETAAVYRIGYQLSPYNAAFIVGASIGAYCPWNAGLITGGRPAQVIA